MAINPLNFLIEVRDSKNLSVDDVRHALGYSLVGDCLENDDWTSLYHAGNVFELRSMAASMVPSYRDLAGILGNPPTAEAWHSARWADPTPAPIAVWRKLGRAQRETATV